MLRCNRIADNVTLVSNARPAWVRSPDFQVGILAATPVPPAPVQQVVNNNNYFIFTSPAAPATDSRFGSTELTNMEMAGIVVSIVVGGLFFIIVLIKLGAIFVRWWSSEKDGAASLDEARSKYSHLSR